LVVFELRLDPAGFVRDDPHDSIVTSHGDDLARFVPADPVGTVGADVVLGSFFDGSNIPNLYYAIGIAAYD
jgi:hypothetical protein